MYWEVPGRDRVAWRAWGDEVAVYVGSTGSTHLLDAGGGTLLLSLLRRDRAASLDQLVADAWDGTPPPDAPEQVNALLEQLRKLGLAAPVAP